MADTTPNAAPGFRRLSLTQSLLTAVAAGISYGLTRLLHMPGGYWAAISSIVVMQSEVGATVSASRDRLAGTALGAVVGWMAAHVWHGSVFGFALAVLAVMLLCYALRFQNASRLGGVTVAIIVLIPHAGPVWHVAAERFLEVSFGIAISLGVALGWQHLAARAARS